MIRQEFGEHYGRFAPGYFYYGNPICDARKDHPDQRMDPEEAIQIAKCIVEALTDAGLQIGPISKN